MAAFAGPTRSALPDVSFLVAAYGLTPAEARVATQVALGKSIKETAQELRVQPTTVRTQLDSVFRKTGTGKQSEMVAELLSLPDMRPPARVAVSPRAARNRPGERWYSKARIIGRSPCP